MSDPFRLCHTTRLEKAILKTEQHNAAHCEEFWLAESREREREGAGLSGSEIQNVT